MVLNTNQSRKIQKPQYTDELKYYKEISGFLPFDQSSVDVSFSQQLIDNIISQSVPTFTRSVLSSVDTQPRDLLNSKHVPPEIKRMIAGYRGKTIQYVGAFHGVDVTFYVQDIATSKPERFDPMLQKLFRVFNYLFSITRSSVSSASSAVSSNFFLYLTPLKKTLPSKPNETISPIHCNSAVTNPCTDTGNTLVYREEEWEKCLLHELFHSRCLDMNRSAPRPESCEKEINRLFGTMFNLPGDVSFRETYCEWWAVNLFCISEAVAAAEMMPGDDTINKSLEFYELFISTERIHSLLQTAKIFRYWNVEFRDIVAPKMYPHDTTSLPRRPVPPENTNVFCYYVLKSMLLFNNKMVSRWFAANNTVPCQRGGTADWAARFAEYVESIVISEAYELEIQRADRTLQLTVARFRDAMRSKQSNETTAIFCNDSMRMTALSNL